MFSFLSLCLFAISDVELKHHASIYNQLPSVETASCALLKRDNFERFREEFGTLVHRHGFADTVGLRLIHAHFRLNDNEQMCEDFEMIDNTPALVTQPQNQEKINSKAYPASWLFSGNGNCVPFEYASDPAVKRVREKLDALPAFFNEVSELILNHQYETLLALAILKRDYLPATEYGYFEQSYANEYETQKSILLSANNVITDHNPVTAWRFDLTPRGSSMAVCCGNVK